MSVPCEGARAAPPPATSETSLLSPLSRVRRRRLGKSGDAADDAHRADAASSSSSASASCYNMQTAKERQARKSKASGSTDAIPPPKHPPKGLPAVEFAELQRRIEELQKGQPSTLALPPPPTQPAPQASTVPGSPTSIVSDGVAVSDAEPLAEPTPQAVTSSPPPQTAVEQTTGVKVGSHIRLRGLVQHPSFNGVEGTVTGRGEDGRWHMSLTAWLPSGKAYGFHLRYVKEQNIEVVDGPTPQASGVAVSDAEPLADPPQDGCDPEELGFFLNSPWGGHHDWVEEEETVVDDPASVSVAPASLTAVCKAMPPYPLTPTQPQHPSPRPLLPAGAAGSEGPEPRSDGLRRRPRSKKSMAAREAFMAAKAAKAKGQAADRRPKAQGQVADRRLGADRGSQKKAAGRHRRPKRCGAAPPPKRLRGGTAARGRPSSGFFVCVCVCVVSVFLAFCSYRQTSLRCRDPGRGLVWKDGKI